MKLEDIYTKQKRLVINDKYLIVPFMKYLKWSESQKVNIETWLLRAGGKKG